MAFRARIALLCSMRFPFKRVGMVGVAAFAVKGLLWLAVPALLALKGC